MILRCTTTEYPHGIGSTLTIERRGGKLTDAKLKLHDGSSHTGVGDNHDTEGWYRVSETTFNERNTAVNYLYWVSGGNLKDSGDVPRYMVLYNFDANYSRDREVGLGTIEWFGSGHSVGKTERLYDYRCNEWTSPPV